MNNGNSLINKINWLNKISLYVDESTNQGGLDVVSKTREALVEKQSDSDSNGGEGL